MPIRTIKSIIVLFVISATMSAHADIHKRTTALYNDVALHRGINAVMWAMPAVSIRGFLKGVQRDLGGNYNDIIYFSKPVEPKHQFLTPNNQVPYAISIMNTRVEPVIVEIPAATHKAIFFGSIIDAWQLPVVDVGPAGEDKGKGGKYLFLPPGYQGDIPDGYHVYRPSTYHLYIGLRPVPISGGTFDDAVDYAKTLKIYPLSQANTPEVNRYIDAYPKAFSTLPEYDLGFFEDLVTILNEEPVQSRDLAMMGLLSSLGIKKGDGFDPDEDTRSILKEAIAKGYQQMQAFFTTSEQALKTYWPNNQWQTLNFSEEQITHGFPYLSPQQLMIDERSSLYFWASFLPKKLGKGSFYLMSLRDKHGHLYSGDSTYRLTVPKRVPASAFWSVIAYSMKTKALIKNSPLVGASSQITEKFVYNSDGTLDLYFGPEPLKGYEDNWIPTGEDFFLIFRLYGPEKALLDKSWVLSDLEKVY